VVPGEGGEEGSAQDWVGFLIMDTGCPVFFFLVGGDYLGGAQ
jgi:hypothetical protein